MTHCPAIDCGGTRTSAAGLDQTLTLISRAEVRSQVADLVDKVIQRIIDVARSVVPTGEQPTAIGISGIGGGAITG